MRLKLKFIKDETANGVEVIVKAKERDRDVEKIIGLLGGETEDVIVGKTLTDNGVNIAGFRNIFNQKTLISFL